MKEFLAEHGFLASGGQVTDQGWKLVSFLLDCMGPLPQLTPGQTKSPYGIFEKYMSKVVSVALEMALVRDGKVYLTYRNDQFFKGWHIPGSFIAPRETLEQTAQRIATREVPGIRIISVRSVGPPVNHPDNPRFHDLSVVVVAEFEGEPTAERGRWFSECPRDLLDVHRSFWSMIEDYLRSGF